MVDSVQIVSEQMMDSINAGVTTVFQNQRAIEAVSVQFQYLCQYPPTHYNAHYRHLASTQHSVKSIHHNATANDLQFKGI